MVPSTCPLTIVCTLHGCPVDRTVHACAHEKTRRGDCFSSNVKGIIWVIDSSDKELFPPFTLETLQTIGDSHEYLLYCLGAIHKIKKRKKKKGINQRIPLLILANKQDLGSHVLSVEDIRMRLGITWEKIPWKTFSSAHDGLPNLFDGLEGCKEILRIIYDYLPGIDFDELSMRKVKFLKFCRKELMENREVKVQRCVALEGSSEKHDGLKEGIQWLVDAIEKYNRAAE